MCREGTKCQIITTNELINMRFRLGPEFERWRQQDSLDFLSAIARHSIAASPVDTKVPLDDDGRLTVVLSANVPLLRWL
jgi:hypothetical protein